MIGQTLAIFLDAYRELNARKLFWITLILSAVVVIAFALLGLDAQGLSVAGYHFDVPDAALVYKGAFATLVVGIWLTWAATILALISTAGLFPEFIGNGSIDLFLAKPIGRARLFLTKYVAGLLFVLAQVTLVVVGSYVVLGARGHLWNANLFWAIPIVVCFFSYLFSICVLLGVKTRSTIAALLLTILCWAFFALLDRTEPMLLMMEHVYAFQARQQQQTADFDRQSLAAEQGSSDSAEVVASLRRDADERQQEADSGARSAKILGTIHRVVYAVKTVTPKTTDTIGLLDRWLVGDVPAADAAGRPSPRGRNAEDSEAFAAGTRETGRDMRARTWQWVIGTSLVFEVVIVCGAMWIFCRRDY